MELYKDHTQSPKKRAQDLLARMTIDEKMAPVTSAYAGFAKIDDDIKNGIGELPTLRMVGFKTLKEALEWRDNLQKRVLANSPHKIPATFHMEGLCGAYIPGATSFPAGISRGASWDPELERRIGEVVSRQERALGITRILAPVQIFLEIPEWAAKVKPMVKIRPSVLHLVLNLLKAFRIVIHKD